MIRNKLSTWAKNTKIKYYKTRIFFSGDEQFKTHLRSKILNIQGNNITVKAYPVHTEKLGDVVSPDTRDVMLAQIEREKYQKVVLKQ